MHCKELAMLGLWILLHCSGIEKYQFSKK